MDYNFSLRKVALLVIVMHAIGIVCLYFCEDITLFSINKKPIKVSIIKLPPKVVLSSLEHTPASIPTKQSRTANFSFQSTEKQNKNNVSPSRPALPKKKEAIRQKEGLKIAKEKKTVNSSDDKHQEHLISQLENVLTSLPEVKNAKPKEDLKVPGKIHLSSPNTPFFKIEPSSTLTTQSLILENDGEDFLFLNSKELIIAIMRENLKLPEIGEVQLKFTINTVGEVVNLKILSHKSSANCEYLLRMLPTLSFSFINQEKKPHTLIVTFKNED